MPGDMKGLIAATYADLVRRGNIDKITVKALIDACHISRQTFYYHFQDLMDVLGWSVGQMTQRLVERSLAAGSPRAALAVFVSFSVEHYPMLRKLMDSQRRAQMEQLMTDAMSGYLSAMAQAREWDLSISGGDRELLLRYNACGLVGVLLSWCGRPDLDQERLTRQLERILAGELAGWTGRSEQPAP